MIYFDKVSKVYSPTSIALEDVSFSIEPQEFVSVVGQSGSGKTTLLKLLLAEEKPTAGKVFFESLDVSRLSNGELPKLRRRIGAVFQDYKLLPTKTAYENVAFAMEAAGKTDELPLAGETLGQPRCVGPPGREFARAINAAWLQRWLRSLPHVYFISRN